MFLLICFLSSTIICFLYDVFFFARAFREGEYGYAKATEGLSIVVCARDEAVNLEANIKFWCDQRLEKLEVIVVNDHSTDGSARILEAAAESFSQLRVLEAKGPDGIGKRNALRQGIEAAQFEYVLLTDADCRPSSLFWAGRMLAAMKETGAALVLGIGNYNYRRGVLNGFIRFETLITALQFFGASANRLSYMALGRNMAVRKEAALQVLQDESDWPSLSGDDDQLAQGIARRWKVARVAHPDAITWSEPKSNFKAWMRQKSRHVGASRHYSLKAKIIAGLYPFARVVGGLSLILILFFQPSWWIFFLWLVLKGIHWSILRMSNLHIQSGLAVHEIVCFDFAWGVYYLVSPFWLAIFKSDSWE